MPPRKRLGQVLTEQGVIDEHQLQSALGHQKQWGGKLGSALVQKGFCSEPQIVAALAKHLGMPMVSLATAKIDQRAVKYVSKQIAEKLHVFPYEVSGSGRSEVVTIAMSDPTDLAAVDQLAFHTGKRIKPMLAGDSEILTAIAQHYGPAEEKKVPTDKMAKPGPSPAAPPTQPAEPFPRRVEPPQPSGGRPSFSPPPPAQAPTESAAPTEPLDIPEPEGDGAGPMPGLEPIAAHTQVESVEGAQEISADGTPADPIEGFEAAGVRHEGAEQAWGGEAPPAEQSSPAGEGGGWGAEQPSEEWAEPVQTEADPGWGGDPASEPAPWTDPLGSAQWPAAAENGAGEWTEEGVTQPQPAPEWGAPGADPASGEADAAQQEQAAEAPEEWSAASEDPLAAGGPSGLPGFGEAAAEASMESASAPALEGEWGVASEPPMHGIAEQAGAEAESAAESLGGEAGGELDDFEIEHEAAEEPAAEPGQGEPADELLAAGGAGSAEEPAAAGGSGLPAGMGAEGESAIEGWTAAPHPQQTRWTPSGPLSLSPADEGTLASVGIDPSDGIAALRTLAALVRVLQRRQLLDPDELAAELREGRPQERMPSLEDYAEQAPSAAQETPHPQDLEGSPGAHPGPPDT